MDYRQVTKNPKYRALYEKAYEKKSAGLHKGYQV